MRRRDFLGALGGAVAWPLVVRAQQGERVRRVGVLMNLAADDPESSRRLIAFVQALQQLGWTDGGNIRIDSRLAGHDADRLRKSAEALLALTPDVILANGTPSVVALQRTTRTVPVVFVNVVDPVGAGFVDSLARPGRNTTGFLLYEFGLSAKWLELLKEIAPGVTRVAVIRDSSNVGGIGQLGAIQAVAPSFGVELRPIDMQNVGEIERTVADFVRGPNDGLIVTSSTLAVVHRDLFIALAARHHLPAVHAESQSAHHGGLISFGVDAAGSYRQAAGYVDRILKGEKPADLPVQAPTKYRLSINLKTAKALGLEVPPTLLARADEVIE